jgi:uncharacterized protein YbjQ (UPF0145 family)
MARRNNPDFDLSFNDDENLDDLEGGEEEGEEAPSSSRVEQLPPSPMLGGSPQHSSIHGSGAYTSGGRATSVRLFSQASAFPQVVQLRVWKVEMGVPVGLGVIDAAATEEDLVRQWYSAMPRPGEGRAIFKLRPIDVDGREIGQEITIPISEHHAVLQQIRSAAAVPTNPPGFVPSSTSALPHDLLALMRETIGGTTRALDDERARARELMTEMARERVDLASNAATGVQAIAERMMSTEAQRAEATLRAEQQRNQQSSDSMAAFFQSQLEMIRADREKAKEDADRVRERDELRFQQSIEEERRRRDRDQQEWERRMVLQQQDFDRKMRQEKEEADRKLERERLEKEERERERDRQHNMKMRELEIAKERDREHAERMMVLQQAQLTVQAQAAGGGLKDTIKEVSGMLQSIGVEPAELVQKLLSRGDEGGSSGPGEGWTDLIGKVVGTAGEVVKEQIKTKRVAAMAEAGVTPPQFQPGMGAPGPFPMVPPGYGGGYPGMMPQQRMLPGPVGGMPQVPPGYMLVQGPNGQPVMVPAQQMQQMQQGYPQQGVPCMEDDEEEDDEDDEGDEDGEDEGDDEGDDEEEEAAAAPATIALNPNAQKAARSALRVLVAKLGKTKEPEWEPLIATGIANEPSIYHYIQAITVKRALAEAGANPKLTARIMAALKASALIPSDLRYE